MIALRRLTATLTLSLAVATTAQAQTRSVPAFQPTMTPVATVTLRPVLQVAAPTPAPTPAPAPAAGGFATSGFAQFMASPAGRIFRVVAGAGMIAGGIAMDNTSGNVLAIAGAVPLSAGLFDVCWLSPIFGGPLHGNDIRAAKK